MDISLTVRNYRCFGEEPVTLRLREGFLALVGMNNSGKSSLLRMPYELRPMLVHADALWNAATTGSVGVWFAPAILPGERLTRAGSSRPYEVSLEIHSSPSGALRYQGQPMTLRFTVDHTIGVISCQAAAHGQPIKKEELAGFTASDIAPLRDASAALGTTLYVGPFRNAISVGSGQAYYDLQIGTGFIANFAEYKSGANPEHNEAVVALIDDVRRIFGYRTLDLNATPDKNSLQVTADGRSYRLSELGSGLAHFIVVLVNVLIRRPTFLLIDEPELNLHAALQLDFLSALAKSTDYGVAFATHSLGLARSGADRMILVSRTDGQASIARPYEGHRDLPSMAAQLGFDGRPELGFERILLVEGKTEVRTLLQLLRLYGKEHRIALVPLGGGELIHATSDVELRELMRLGPVAYLIDSERTELGGAPSQRHKAFAELCAKLGLEGHMLERRAIENYLPQTAITAVFGDSKTALGAYARHGNGQGWSKTQNWRVAAQMSRADLEGTDLGNFLEAL